MFSPRAKKPVRTYARQRKPQLSLYVDEPAPKRRRVIVTPLEIATPPTPTTASSPESFEANKTPYPYSTSPESSSSPICDAPAIPTSSPKDEPIFSDAARDSIHLSSPLRRSSSPSVQSSPPTVPARTRRPMFAFMKRKAVPHPPSKKLPLADSNSGQNRQASVEAKQPPKKKRLVQMQLDLVGELRKKCATCGMEYIPSNAEDAGMHKKFHAQNVGGVDLTKAFVEKIRQNTVWEGGHGGFIATISRKDTFAFRNKADQVLKVVNTELSAVAISDEALWSKVRVQSSEGIGGGERDEKGRGERGGSDRFKMYLYIRGSKCVGACLAERIQEAFAVADQDKEDTSERKDTVPAILPVPSPGDEQQSSSISISRSPEPAMLGISRIWTSKVERKKGIATTLLDTAREDFLYGIKIEKDAMAFSQPTASGGELARKWFGRRSGWHVYIDED